MQNANRVHLRDGARAGGQIVGITLNPLELLGRGRCVVSGVCWNNKSDGIICSRRGDVNGGHKDSLRVAGERRDVRLKGRCGARAQSTDRKEDNEQHHRSAKGLQSGKVLLHTSGGGAGDWVLQETSKRAAELQTATPNTVLVSLRWTTEDRLGLVQHCDGQLSMYVCRPEHMNSYSCTSAMPEGDTINPVVSGPAVRFGRKCSYQPVQRLVGAPTSECESKRQAVDVIVELLQNGRGIFCCRSSRVAFDVKGQRTGS